MFYVFSTYGAETSPQDVLDPTIYTAIQLMSKDASKASGVYVTDSEHLRWEISFKDIELGKIIGKGSFGTVYHGTWGDKQIACKMLSKDTGFEIDIASFIRESDVMRRITSHANCLKYYGICCNTDFPFCIITEFIANGSLRSIIEKNMISSNKVKLHIIKGIVQGMIHLSNEKVVHRDLASRNILITEDFNAKISDFGLSRMLSQEQSSDRTVTSLGPIRWMAPESIRDLIYSEKSDVWSFGVTVFEIIVSLDPYPGVHLTTVGLKVISRQIKLDYPKNIVGWSLLLDDCLSWNTENRPTFREISQRLEAISVDEDHNWKIK